MYIENKISWSTVPHFGEFLHVLQVWLVVFLSTVGRQTFDQRRLLVDVSHQTVNQVVETVRDAEVEGRDEEHLLGLQFQQGLEEVVRVVLGFCVVQQELQAAVDRAEEAVDNHLVHVVDVRLPDVRAGVTLE